MADKTVITFKFIQACGIQLDGYGNFSPANKMRLDTNAPKNLGNVWVDSWDPDDVYTVTLLDEEPRDLPEHINRTKDEAVKVAFHIKQAELAASRHEENNKVRDELAALEKKGRIKVLSDSFMDKLMAEVDEPEPVVKSKHLPHVQIPLE